MNLRSALSNMEGFVCSNDILDQNVGKIAIRSEHVKPRDIFICLKDDEEAKENCKRALSLGAIAVICERDLGFGKQIIVENSRKAYALISKALNHNVCDKLKLIAVTGTNGKTTTSKIIADILSQSGKKVGVIGTLGAGEAGTQTDTGFTTPDPDILHGVFRKLQARGVEYVVMEASAHALELHKLDGLKFEAAVFTNLTQDHLDFFGEMENYFKAKEKLFMPEMTKFGIVNIDDHYGKRLASYPQIPLISFSTLNKADAMAENIETSFDGTRFSCELFGDEFDIESSLVGDYNAQNLLGALVACKMLGVGNEQLKKFAKNIAPAEGRFNKIDFKGASIIVDFAHTPDGLEKVLTTAKKITKGKLMCVFGCGGNRDRGKRPIMGKITEELCDKVFLTSDNPRFEKPEEIIAEIEKGMVKDSHVIYVDRAEAIAHAMLDCTEGDCLVIAGKGGEKYQDIGGVKHHYDDFEVIETVLIESEKKERLYAD